MSGLDPDDAQVTYTVKELLQSIKDEQSAGFSRLETGLSTKADKADVARMEARMDGHDRRITGLEQQSRDQDHESSGHRKAVRLWFTATARIGGAVVGLAVVATGLAAVLGLHF